MSTNTDGGMTKEFFVDPVTIEGKTGVVDSVREAAFNDGSRPNLIGGGKPAGFQP